MKDDVLNILMIVTIIVGIGFGVTRDSKETKETANLVMVQEGMSTPFLEYAKIENIQKRMMGENQDFRFYLASPRMDYVTLNLNETYAPLSLK